MRRANEDLLIEPITIAMGCYIDRVVACCCDSGALVCAGGWAGLNQGVDQIPIFRPICLYINSLALYKPFWSRGG